MNYLEVIILGIVQGITEFLPISSSGHLIAIPELFGWEARGLAFDTMMHLATFIAVVYVFWSEIRKMAIGMVTKKEKKYGQLGWMVVVATIPVVLVGLLLGDYIDATIRTVNVVAWSLIVWGVVLGFADYIGRRNKNRVDKEVAVGWKRTIIIGLVQTLALIPGTSRSGVTMTAGLFAGLDRKTTARFSFLLSIPAVGGAAAYVILKAIMNGVQILTPELIVGFVAALISGVLAIRFLLKVIEKWSFMPFAVYRVLLGILLLLLL
ncbi:undecaprenyl-diphosphate phosphatase [Candidatus Uhrbacteria bacterium]|nr:undecaprenyl-diphosphate phosphatase [Candidatus Uhrbacteria bacterium]